MIVVMDPDAPEAAVEAVIGQLVACGFDVHRSSGQSRTLLGVVGAVTDEHVATVRELEHVTEVVRVSEPYRLASRRFRQAPTVHEGPWGTIGGDRLWIAVEALGRRPEEALPHAVAAGRPFDAAVVRDGVEPENVGALECLPLGRSRGAQRWPLVFVERAPSWGANHWIGAAERELERADCGVVLLEAGGEYPTGARTLEIAAIARAKQRTHLPLVVDAPTIAQRSRYVAAVACAAVGAGADGVLLRVWVGSEERPRSAATLRWAEAMELAERLRAIAAVVRR